jgi:hypothetical protein
MFRKNFFIKLVWLILLAGLMEIASLFVDFLAVLIHRLLTRILVLRVGDAG